MTLKQKAIDAVFQIMENREKAKALDDFHASLGFENDNFSYHAFLETNEVALLEILNWYFYELLGTWHPDAKDFYGLASYALYDAATPYIDGKPYYLKNKAEFERYIEDELKNQGKNNV